MSKKTDVLHRLIGLEIVLSSLVTGRVKMHQLQQGLTILRFLVLKSYMEAKHVDFQEVAQTVTNLHSLPVVDTTRYACLFEMEVALLSKKKTFIPRLTHTLFHKGKLKYRQIFRLLQEKKRQQATSFVLDDFEILLFRSLASGLKKD